MVAIRSDSSLDLFFMRIRTITITTSEIAIIQIAQINNDCISGKDLLLTTLTLYKISVSLDIITIKKRN